MALTGMGIGRLGSETALLKRKFRWLFHLTNFEISGAGNIVAGIAQTGHIAKIASRPSMSFNEQEVRHVIENVFLPAKATWDPLDITVYDLSGDDYLYTWLKEFYDPEEGVVSPVGSAIFQDDTATTLYPKKLGVLVLLDGHGNSIERWELQGCWPLSINWGEVDYTSSDTLDVQFQLRYDRAVRFDS